MNSAQIIDLQKRIGATPDGFWGPKSVAACQSYLRKLMPVLPRWPATDQASLTAFYGPPGEETRLVRITPPAGTCYEGQPAKSILCHSKVADSLARILAKLAEVYPAALARYDGCYNNRSMRGGSLPSLHARGAAIDLMASTNDNRDHWPTASDMPLEVMEVFAREGWISAGAFWGRDAMHFQATR